MRSFLAQFLQPHPIFVDRRRVEDVHAAGVADGQVVTPRASISAPQIPLMMSISCSISIFCPISLKVCDSDLKTII